MTAYQKRKQERDQSRKEVRELKRLIFEMYNGTAKHNEVLPIVMRYKIDIEIERSIWQGATKTLT